MGKTLLYSEVDANLQKELNARGLSGKRRTTEDLDFMLGKKANVEVHAYKNQDSKLKSAENILYKLGGREVTKGDYLASGFLSSTRVLNKIKSTESKPTPVRNNTHKLPPFIVSCDMTTVDSSSVPILNSATIHINIPNPDLDLEFMESTFARPGRAITLIIEYPDSAVITGERLLKTSLQTSLSKTNANDKINRVEFDGLVISFDMTYEPAGSISLVLHLRGTSNIYVETPLTVDTTSEQLATTDVKTYYEVLNGILNGLEKVKEPRNAENTILDVQEVTVTAKKTSTSANITPIAVVNPTSEQVSTPSTAAFLVSSYFKNIKETKRYMQLGYLINTLNTYILQKNQTITPSPTIQCNDEITQSYYLENLVSGDPENILLLNHDQYGMDGDNPRYFFTSKQRDTFISQVKDTLDYKSTTDPKLCYPGRILINIIAVRAIIAELKAAKQYTAKDFIVKISQLIYTALGGAIDLKLVTDPNDDTLLLLVDKNFIGTGKSDIKPYSVPMFANHINGTIVRDFSFSSKLPQNMQSLMYTVNNSSQISEEQISPYVHFMFNNAFVTRSGNTDTTTIDTKLIDKLKEQYRKTHEDIMLRLNASKNKLGQSWLNAQAILDLELALKKYVQYPTDDIQKSNQMQAPVYPFDVEFTIDGINGLRWGNVLEFNGLPAKYKNKTTFIIASIIQTVTTDGDWTTKIRCIMRPKI